VTGNSETSLANVGARYAAVGGLPTPTQDPTCGTNSAPTAAVIVTYVNCEAQYVYTLTTGSSTTGFQGPVTVTVCAPGGTAVGDPVEVKVRASYKWLPLFNFVSVNPSTPVTAIATMRTQAVTSGQETLPASC
jgi:hypothetical protein